MTYLYLSKSSLSRERGFTMIEILATLLIMSVFTVIALTGMGAVVDDARFNQTLREMEQIRGALAGETQRLETGLRKDYGYMGDVGQLPASAQGISALLSQPVGVASWSINASYGVGFGWRGPYLIPTSTDQDFTKDAWGNNYIYTSTGTTATLSSYGSDGASGGSDFATDIVLDLPITVTRGTLYGYVVRAQGDVIGADQVPFSSDAQIVLYYANGSGGVTSTSQTISVGNSGRYTFSSVPLGVAAIKVFIPNVATATGNNILGPTVVEINKAATAAVPVAQDTSTIYASSQACTSNENFSIISNSFVKDDAGRYIQYDIRFPAQYSWSAFYAHQDEDIPITQFTLTNTSTTSSTVYRYSATPAAIVAGGNANMAAETSFTINPSVVLSAAVTYRLKFEYSTGGTVWSNGSSSDGGVPSIFYHQIGCKFVRAHPGMY